MQIYKRNQGKHTRWLTLAGVLVIAAIGAWRLSENLGAVLTEWRFLQYLVPVVLLVGVGLATLLLVNRPKTADFLIATESEIKKVSWSSRREIIGSTKVVIVATLILTVLLFAVDNVFLWFFRMVRVIEF